MASIERKALECSVGGSVEFVGQRNAQEVYEDIDIVLIPSYEETFSLVALEAMAKGVLVVAANTGGIPEVVLNGKTGLLFEIGRASELADRVATAITEPALATQIAASAQKRAAEAFGIEKTVSAVTRVIMDTINGNEIVHD